MTEPRTAEQVEQHMRDMIADRLSEYQRHSMNATSLTASIDDAESDDERAETVALASIEATLASAAATAMQALTAFWQATRTK